jgi:hypothetical protein
MNNKKNEKKVGNVLLRFFQVEIGSGCLLPCVHAKTFMTIFLTFQAFTMFLSLGFFTWNLPYKNDKGQHAYQLQATHFVWGV